MRIKISKSEKHLARRAWFIWYPITGALLVWCWFLADAALTARFGA